MVSKLKKSNESVGLMRLLVMQKLLNLAPFGTDPFNSDNNFQTVNFDIQPIAVPALSYSSLFLLVILTLLASMVYLKKNTWIFKS